MKRTFPFPTEEDKNDDNGNKQCRISSNSSTSSDDANYNSDSSLPKSTRSHSNEAQSSEAASLPTSTTTQSFPWMSTTFNRGSELFNADSSQNPFMMPFNRNCAWPDNRMFGMSLSDPNMTVNSTAMPFLRNGDNLAKNLRETESQGNSKDSQVAERPPTPLPTFTAEEVNTVNEMLKEKHTLRQGLKILMGWLRKGDCTKSNNNDFTDMIKYAHNQVWRLMSEKTEIKEELNEERREVTKGLNNLASHFDEISKVLETSKLQKVWDQFTKPQRKQIEVWVENAKQLKDVFTGQKDDDDEDINDDDVHRSPDSSQDHEIAELRKEYQKLKEQFDCLQSQFQTIENETENTLRGKEEKEKEHSEKITVYQEKCLTLETNITKMKKYKVDALASLKKKEAKNVEQPKLCPRPSSVEENRKDGIEIKEKEVFLLVLISSFLYVHPFGASLDYICSYLSAFAPYLTTRHLENLLIRFPEVFKEEKRGIGATLSRCWYFMGFKELN